MLRRLRLVHAGRREQQPVDVSRAQLDVAGGHQIRPSIPVRSNAEQVLAVVEVRGEPNLDRVASMRSSRAVPKRRSLAAARPNSMRIHFNVEATKWGSDESPSMIMYRRQASGSPIPWANARMHAKCAGPSRRCRAGDVGALERTSAMAVMASGDQAWPDP